MTSLPVNARSEFVTPANFSEGGVCDTTRRFQDAAAAFVTPARRPTRRSGLGAVVDMSSFVEAHAARDNNPRASESGLVTDAMAESCEGGRTSGWTRVHGGGVVIGRALRTAGWRACPACG